MRDFHQFRVIEQVPPDAIEVHSIIEYQRPKGYRKYAMGGRIVTENGLDVPQEKSLREAENARETGLYFGRWEVVPSRSLELQPFSRYKRTNLHQEYPVGSCQTIEKSGTYHHGLVAMLRDV
jgi:hypothetical protein